MKHAVCVYLMELETDDFTRPLYKIGFTKNIKQRFSDLRARLKATQILACVLESNEFSENKLLRAYSPYATKPCTQKGPYEVFSFDSYTLNILLNDFATQTITKWFVNRQYPLRIEIGFNHLDTYGYCKKLIACGPDDNYGTTWITEKIMISDIFKQISLASNWRYVISKEDSFIRTEETRYVFHQTGWSALLSAGYLQINRELHGEPNIMHNWTWREGLDAKIVTRSTVHVSTPIIKGINCEIINDINSKAS